MYRYNVSNILSTAEGNEKDAGVIDLELVIHKERLPTITSHWIFDRSINPRRIVNVLKKLLSSVSSIRETADGLTKKLDALDGVKETLEHIEDKKVMKVLVEFSRKLWESTVTGDQLKLYLLRQRSHILPQKNPYTFSPILKRLSKWDYFGIIFQGARRVKFWCLSLNRAPHLALSVQDLLLQPPATGSMVKYQNWSKYLKWFLWTYNSSTITKIE